MAADRVGTLEHTLVRSWARRGVLAYALAPITAVYALATGLRRLLYRAGVLQAQRVNAVVLVVGNVVVGGAGKTPTTISIVQHWRNKGLQVGVVSRGYGRKDDTNCLEVTASMSPHLAGDEPLLIRRATGAPVFVARSRYAAATALLAQYPSTQVVVCDDGLQHYALYRDLEVCVFDDRGIGNGLLLPSGPLREAWPLKPIAAIGQQAERRLVLNTGGASKAGEFSAHRRLAPYAKCSDGTRIALTELALPSGKPLMALAGIARPERFFDMLRAQGLTIAETLALPDHYDFDSLPHNIHERYQLVCTEKDALKLWAGVPNALAIPLEQTAEPTFFDALDACILKVMESRSL